MIDLIAPTNHERPFRLLCIGAHADDIEIGCGGLIRSLVTMRPRLSICWVVLTASGLRARENRKSALALTRRAEDVEVVDGAFDDGFLPSQHREVKTFFEGIKTRFEPDLILTHRLEDRHQDHRLAAELTWNTFRDHLVLEYEIAKYEGDLGHPNVYVPLTAKIAAHKVSHLMKHYGTQRSKAWFEPDAFHALLRLRGLECRAPSGLAEAFHARKLRLNPVGA